MADYAQDIESMRQLIKGLAKEVETLKKAQQAANNAIGDLHADVADLRKRLKSK